MTLFFLSFLFRWQNHYFLCVDFYCAFVVFWLAQRAFIICFCFEFCFLFSFFLLLFQKLRSNVLNLLFFFLMCFSTVRLFVFTFVGLCLSFNLVLLTTKFYWHNKIMNIRYFFALTVQVRIINRKNRQQKNESSNWKYFYYYFLMILDRSCVEITHAWMISISSQRDDSMDDSSIRDDNPKIKTLLVCIIPEIFYNMQHARDAICRNLSNPLW